MVARCQEWKGEREEGDREKAGGGVVVAMCYFLTVSMAISLVVICTIVLQDVTTEGN